MRVSLALAASFLACLLPGRALAEKGPSQSGIQAYLKLDLEGLRKKVVAEAAPIPKGTFDRSIPANAGYLGLVNWSSGGGTELMFKKGDPFEKFLVELFKKVEAGARKSAAAVPGLAKAKTLFHRCAFFHGHITERDGALAMVFHTLEYPADVDDKCGDPNRKAGLAQIKVTPVVYTVGAKKDAYRAAHNLIYSFKTNEFRSAATKDFEAGAVKVDAPTKPFDVNYFPTDPNNKLPGKLIVKVSK
jgi:hypothetical protein